MSFPETELRAQVADQGSPKGLRVHDVAAVLRNSLPPNFEFSGECGTFAGPGDEYSEFDFTANGHTYNIVVTEVDA